MSGVRTKEIVVTLPQELIQEMDGVAQMEKVNRNDMMEKAVKMYLHERDKGQIREAMRLGYMEMANINLHISNESFHAEEEAVVTVERLVSGV